MTHLSTIDLTRPLFLYRYPTSVQLAPAPPSDFELSQLDGTAEYDSLANSNSSDARAHTEPSLRRTRREDTSTRPDYEVTPVDREMSRTPLLLRSSPSRGNGSYGVLPMHSALSDEEDTRESSGADSRRSSKSKGKSPLRGTTSDRDGGSPSPSLCDAQEDVAKVRMRRNSLPMKRKGWSSEDASEGLKPGFTASTVPTFDTGPSAVLESLHSSGDSESDNASQNGTAHGPKQNKFHTINMPEEDVPDNSPYAEVRASVAPTDNTTLSINTPRMWTLSILFAIFGSATNLFFSLRYPSVSITPVIALLIVHPMGLLWDRLLKRSNDPVEVFENGRLSTRKRSDDTSSDEYDGTTNQTRLPPTGSARLKARRSWKRRLRLWLAQGKWNEKEHCCVFISSNVSFGFAFATDVGRIDTISSAPQQLTEMLGHCGASEVLQPRGPNPLSDPAYAFHSDTWIRHCRSYTPIPGSAERNDMARNIGFDRHVHQPP